MRVIEFVCTGNQGRSPLAEAIGRDRLQRHGAGSHDTASSGTGVYRLKGWKDGSVPFNPFRARWLLEQGAKRGIYTAEDRSYVGELLRADSEVVDTKNRTVNALTLKTQLFFDSEEQEQRGRAAALFNIRSRINDTPENTRIRPESVVILGMGQGNVDAVREIYAAAASRPAIDTLSNYAPGKTAAEVPDAFALGPKAYFEMVARLKDATLRAVDRALAGT